jgi:hypothetical protein
VHKSELDRVRRDFCEFNISPFYYLTFDQKIYILLNLQILKNVLKFSELVRDVSVPVVADNNPTNLKIPKSSSCNANLNQKSSLPKLDDFENIKFTILKNLQKKYFMF